jgi:hypothetical protein
MRFKAHTVKKLLAYLSQRDLCIIHNSPSYFQPLQFFKKKLKILVRLATRH